MPISRHLLGVAPEAITTKQPDRTCLVIYNNDPTRYIVVNDASSFNNGIIIQPAGLLILLALYSMEPDKIWYATGSGALTICDVLELYGKVPNGK